MKHIEQKAYASGIPRSVFDHICDHIARCRFEDPEPDADIKQYRSESALWSHFWAKEKFPGIQPYPNRAAQTPVSIISSRPAPSSVDYYNYSIGLAEHQQFQQALAEGVSDNMPEINTIVKKENIGLDDMATLYKEVHSLPPKPLQEVSNIPHPSTSKIPIARKALENQRIEFSIIPIVQNNRDIPLPVVPNL